MIPALQRRFAMVLVCLCALDAGAQTLPELSYSRLLRKVHLSLRGTVPSPSDYQAIIDAPDDAAKELLIESAITEGLQSAAFYESMVVYGRDLFGGQEYAHGFEQEAWIGGQALRLTSCPPDTLHAGRLGLFSSEAQYGDSLSLCDDPLASLQAIQPWWDPNGTVLTIGWAGGEHATIPDPEAPGSTIDCGVLKRTNGISGHYIAPNPPDPSVTPRCGCGPNLIYCARSSNTAGASLGDDSLYSDLTSQRRALSDEAARLFAHIVVNSRPLTDLIVGTYTVVTQGLQHAYIRAARQSGSYGYLDLDPWWESVEDATEWREVTVSDIYPLYTSDRLVQFDPRVEYGEPPPLPSAGILTMRGALGARERERPRAARWLERLACKTFTPPTVEFMSVDTVTDPAMEGRCQVCHKILDPVAMHFKRFSTNGARVGGFGQWQWDALDPSDPDRLRWLVQYRANTILTPVTEVDMSFNPDARFLDFAPAGTKLLGQAGDGTIGPLGFGKALVASGDFDRCMVSRLYGRYGGIQLNFALDGPYLNSLVSEFVAGGRDVKGFVYSILTSARYRLGR
ncbi:MAG: hypothetical protein VX223_17020 [Myxococcota bacterium]|nr:hypothetical protein [Myxococcota bacterium]